MSLSLSGGPCDALRQRLRLRLPDPPATSEAAWPKGAAAEVLQLLLLDDLVLVIILGRRLLAAAAGALDRGGAGPGEGDDDSDGGAADEVPAGGVAAEAALGQRELEGPVEDDGRQDEAEQI